MLGAVTLSAAALALVAWISPNNYYQMMSDNELIRSLKKKLNAYNEQMPGDRIYLQFDKPMYEPGDNIWFSAFIRDAATMKPSGKSDIVHVEFLNPKGTVEKSINIIAKNGVAAGDFTLDAEALGGIYKVRAYTNWMKNEGEDNRFEKDIQVQDVVLPNLKMKLDFEKKAFGAGDEVVAKLELNTNENKPLSNYKIKFVANLDGKQIVAKGDVTDENGLQYLKFNLPAELKTNDGLLNVMIDYNGTTESISRSIPIVLNSIRLQLFPEGGDLVNGLESKVAFRALNEFGKPADIEGMIVTEKGAYVSSFSSFHQGMGAFKFVPKEGEKYTVKITKPENIKETFPMPEPLARGYVMDVDAGKTEVALNINTTETEELSLVAQVRNKVYYSTVIDAKKGSNRIVFPTTSFPAGVSQITLFDSKGVARAERLAFVNKDRQLNISVETEKEKYLPREKVKMTISVKDERGMPMPANLSMAVVNDQFLSFADDKSGNILSELLLQQDINQKVEEPAFYFSSKEPKADEALDYLLMTAGWRHFTWEKLANDNLPVASYQGERAIVAGTVLDASTGKIIKNAKIRINNGAEYQTDENGKFIFNKLDLTSPVTLSYNAEGYGAQSQYIQNYNQNLLMYLYNNSYYSGYYNVPASSAGARDMDMVALDDAAPEPLMKVAEMEVMDKPMRKRDENKPALMKEGKAKLANQVADNKKGNGLGDFVRLEQQKNEERKDGAKKQVVFAGLVANAGWARSQEKMQDEEDLQQPVQLYYRAKEFAAPLYDKQENVEVRNDFRNTIYWNPDVEIDRSGKKTVEFYTSDDITSFRTTVEGVAGDGMVGRTEKNFFTQLPFAMSAKVPVEVATEDNLSIPLTLKNNTDKPLGGLLTVTSPDGLQALVAIPAVQTIMPGAVKTIYLDYKVLDKIGYGDFTLTFKSCGLGDAFTQRIKIAPKGFPAQVSFSAQDVEKEYSFSMDHVVKGSVKATFTAFPNVVSDLMKGVEGILQEPYGCFEQTSCTAYPNAMVLDYMKSTDSKDNITLARATDLLNRGYKRLTTFETTEKGYEWFGANPGHEGLTAYGIMEFVDMKNAGADVDQKMLDRTAAWLLKHRDGKGGFNREQHAYHDFGRISDDILNAYIVYALSEAGYSDIKAEFEASYKKAMDTKDPYMLAMMANAAYSLKEKAKADEAMAMLVSRQAKDGSFTGSTHSITYSQGQSLSIETTSLAIMAILKSQGKNAVAMTNAVQYLVGARSGSGVFSSTQGTILALKALTEYAKFSKKTTEDGTIEIYVDGKKVSEKSYKAGDKGAIEISGLEEYLAAEGKHDVKIKYVGVKTPLPYSMAVNYSTFLPNSDKECSIDLKTKLAATTASVGQTVRLTATITNRKSTEVPSTMAIIGIPAGFTVQPWQLKELQDKKVFDYYEMKGNNIAVYYRGMGPSAVKEINLDLKAEMPGTYDAPASSAYLYYTNEFKTWSATDKITIKKNG
ncbi:MAG: large extracellular alpha-helical protein [Bacteroidetes bacterium]|nr:large extracellular alpha-helical protein [Bacteroidota bacterium]